MNDKETKKYEIIKAIIESNITKNEASIILNLSKRQINRLIIKYKEIGEKAFIHKNKGKKSEKAIDKNIKKEIVNLYLSEYYDYNFSHFYEEIESRFKISFQSLINIFNEENIISPQANRKTKTKYNKEMQSLIKNNLLEEKKIQLYESRKLQEEEAHTRKSNLYYQFGEELQMDAAEYSWFGGIITQLHLVVDKATKKVLFGWFDFQETTRSYFILLLNIIMIYGIPRKIKTDKRKTFYEENSLTQFGRACKELNIELESSSNPRYKPNVERMNETFENRLKAELRHENILDIDAANDYLNDIFIPKMNQKFAYNVDINKTKMKINEFKYEELKLIIAEHFKRYVDTGSCIKYNKKYYIPIDKNSNEVYFKNKTECSVIISYDYELWCQVEENYYKLKEIEMKEYTPATAVKELKEELKKEKIKYIPPKNHPWRKSYKT